MGPSNCDTTSGISTEKARTSSGKAPFIFDQHPELYKLCKNLIATTSEKYWSRRQFDKTRFEEELQLMRRAVRDIRATQGASYKEINQAATSVRNQADKESFAVWMATSSRLQAERNAVEPTTDTAKVFASAELRDKQAEYELQANLGLFNKAEWLAENSRQVEQAKALHQRDRDASERVYKQSFATHVEQVEALTTWERLWFKSHSQREIAAFDALEAWHEKAKAERVKMLERFLLSHCVESFRMELLAAIVRVQMC